MVPITVSMGEFSVTDGLLSSNEAAPPTEVKVRVITVSPITVILKSRSV